MQHFKLTLACGHSFETSAVSVYEGAPHHPDYMGKVMPFPPVRCCGGDHTVLVQRTIARLTGREDDPDPAPVPNVAAAQALAEHAGLVSTEPEVPAPTGTPLRIH